MQCFHFHEFPSRILETWIGLELGTCKPGTQQGKGQKMEIGMRQERNFSIQVSNKARFNW